MKLTQQQIDRTVARHNAKRLESIASAFWPDVEVKVSRTEYVFVVGGHVRLRRSIHDTPSDLYRALRAEAARSKAVLDG